MQSLKSLLAVTALCGMAALPQASLAGSPGSKADDYSYYGGSYYAYDDYYPEPHYPADYYDDDDYYYPRPAYRRAYPYYPVPVPFIGFGLGFGHGHWGDD